MEPKDISTRPLLIAGTQLVIGIGPILAIVVDGYLLKEHLTIGSIVEIRRSALQSLAQLVKIGSLRIPFHRGNDVEANKRIVECQRQYLCRVGRSHSMEPRITGVVYVYTGNIDAVGPVQGAILRMVALARALFVEVMGGG